MMHELHSLILSRHECKLNHMTQLLLVYDKRIERKVYEASLEVLLYRSLFPIRQFTFITLLGVLPPLVTVSIIKSISFSVYEETKTFLKAQSPFYARDDNLRSVMTRSTLGGAASGAFVATFSCPVSITCIYPSWQYLHIYPKFELVKIHKQLEILLLQASSISTGATVMRERNNRTNGGGSCNNLPTTSSWHSAKEIVRSKGILGLWSGYGLHFCKWLIIEIVHDSNNTYQGVIHWVLLSTLVDTRQPSFYFLVLNEQLVPWHNFWQAAHVAFYVGWPCFLLILSNPWCKKKCYRQVASTRVPWIVSKIYITPEVQVDSTAELLWPWFVHSRKSSFFIYPFVEKER